MKIDKYIILMTLLFIMGIFVIYFFIRLSNMEEMHTRLLQQDSYSKENRSGQIGDSYIKREIKNTITKNSSEILVCYKDFLNRNKRISGKDKILKKRDGKITVDWQINKDGSVISPQIVRTDLKDKNFENCLIEKIKKWNFPTPPGGINKYVDHTFNFKDKNSATQ